MWWRLTKKEFEKGQGEGNRRTMKKLVDSGIIPGLIAYNNNESCGWCSIAPREQYSSLERSRVLKRVDDKNVWSMVCFYIHKNYRGQNIGEKLMRIAIECKRIPCASLLEKSAHLQKSIKN